MENMYNLNSISRKTLERNKRLESQTNQSLQEAYNKRKLEEENEKRILREAALSGARFGYSVNGEKSKQRVRALTEEINYINDSSTIAMTEMITQVVEKSLLLDEAEYEKLNPHFKEDIRDTVRGLLENGNINGKITNKDTLVLMEYVAKELPATEVGKYLTEDELSELMKKQKPAEVEASINRLSGNVASRVATLVEKEQKKIDNIEKDLNKVAPKKIKAEEDFIDPEMASEDTNVNSEEVSADENIPAKEIPEKEEMDEDPSMTSEVGKSIHIDADGTTSISMPNGQLSLNGDGSMDIQLMENKLVRETPRCGLLESLAVNEAQDMILEGHEYNSDLAIANALTTITIMEAMGELGLLTVNEQVYSKIIASAGGSLNESCHNSHGAAQRNARIVGNHLTSAKKEERVAAQRENERERKMYPAYQNAKAQNPGLKFSEFKKQQDEKSLADKIYEKRLAQEKAKEQNQGK